MVPLLAVFLLILLPFFATLLVEEAALLEAVTSALTLRLSARALARSSTMDLVKNCVISTSPVETVTLGFMLFCLMAALLVVAALAEAGGFLELEARGAGGALLISVKGSGELRVAGLGLGLVGF